jgi:hypothetical protein
MKTKTSLIVSRLIVIFLLVLVTIILPIPCYAYSPSAIPMFTAWFLWLIIPPIEGLVVVLLMRYDIKISSAKTKLFWSVTAVNYIIIPLIGLISFPAYYAQYKALTAFILFFILSFDIIIEFLILEGLFKSLYSQNKIVNPVSVYYTLFISLVANFASFVLGCWYVMAFNYY